MLFTIEEAAELLDPKLEPYQLRQIVQALKWQPAAWRTTGKPGHPKAAYQWDDITRLHAALVPFLP